MMRSTLHKSCIVLVLAVSVLLGLASIPGRTLAYLTATDSSTNVFTFKKLGDSRRDTVNYYYINKSGAATQIRDNGYRDIIWDDVYSTNERVNVDSSNTDIKAAPNGFELSYITVDNDRVNAGEYFLHPDHNSAINVYFAPITYTITYDFNGYDESDITFSQTPLQSTYTVFDMIEVPYEADSIRPYTIYDWQYYLYCWFGGGESIRCQEVPSMEVDNNALLGWDDQSGNTHRYDNASGSWAFALGDVTNTSVYSTFAGRQSGNLVLTARWEYEVRGSNTNSTSGRRMLQETVPTTDNSTVGGSTIESQNNNEEKEEELDGDTATE